VPRSPIAPPRPEFRTAILSLLRGELPRGDFSAAEIREGLKRYECGGHLHHRWSTSRDAAKLPAVWAEALAIIHRKTLIDNLAALADFRAVASLLRDLGAPFLVLKGAAYLADLHDDPGCRLLTDVDLLIREEDAGRVARRLEAAGFKAGAATDFPHTGRFEFSPPGSGRCGFEFHRTLGLPRHFRIDAGEIWSRAEAVTLDGIECRRPGREDSLLYHVAHLADHYFGPSLKWILDLRAMLERWPLDGRVLVERAAGWRVRTALAIALDHLDRIFPGAAPPALVEAVRPGPLRSRLLRRALGVDPIEIAPIAESAAARLPIRWLSLDRPLDAAWLTIDAAFRRTASRLGRRTATVSRPADLP
jgi:hypothetical protein